MSGSGRGDLALATGVGSGNCFTGNDVGRTLPDGLQTSRCIASSSEGDAGVSAALTAPLREMFETTMRRRKPPDYTSMPKPPPQPSLPARR